MAPHSDVPSVSNHRLPQGSRGDGLGGDLPEQGRSVTVEALGAEVRRQRPRVVQILQDDPMPGMWMTSEKYRSFIIGSSGMILRFIEDGLNMMVKDIVIVIL